MSKPPYGYKSKLIRAVLAADPTAKANVTAQQVEAAAAADGYTMSCNLGDIYIYRSTHGFSTHKPEKVVMVTSVKKPTIEDGMSILAFCEQHGGAFNISKKLKDFIEIKHKFGSVDTFMETLLSISKLTNNKKVAENLAGLEIKSQQ